MACFCFATGFREAQLNGSNHCLSRDGQLDGSDLTDQTSTKMLLAILYFCATWEKQAEKEIVWIVIDWPCTRGSFEPRTDERD